MPEGTDEQTYVMLVTVRNDRATTDMSIESVARDINDSLDSYPDIAVRPLSEVHAC